MTEGVNGRHVLGAGKKSISCCQLKSLKPHAAAATLNPTGMSPASLGTNVAFIDVFFPSRLRGGPARWVTQLPCTPTPQRSTWQPLVTERLSKKNGPPPQELFDTTRFEPGAAASGLATGGKL